jgi:hypothetical protein
MDRKNIIFIKNHGKFFRDASRDATASRPASLCVTTCVTIIFLYKILTKLYKTIVFDKFLFYSGLQNFAQMLKLLIN